MLHYKKLSGTVPTRPGYDVPLVTPLVGPAIKRYTYYQKQNYYN